MHICSSVKGSGEEVLMEYDLTSTPHRYLAFARLTLSVLSMGACVIFLTASRTEFLSLKCSGGNGGTSVEGPVWRVSVEGECGG